ncbi:hypothetical protein V8068_001162 [Vibrio parahaemolyticus]
MKMRLRCNAYVTTEKDPNHKIPKGSIVEVVKEYPADSLVSHPDCNGFFMWNADLADIGAKPDDIIEVSSEKKDATYVATVLLFDSVKQMAIHKIGSWELYEAMTDDKRSHYITEYRNGKMFVRAVSYGDSHIYSFGEIENERI